MCSSDLALERREKTVDPTVGIHGRIRGISGDHQTHAQIHSLAQKLENGSAGTFGVFVGISYNYAHAAGITISGALYDWGLGGVGTVSPSQIGTNTNWASLTESSNQLNVLDKNKNLYSFYDGSLTGTSGSSPVLVSAGILAAYAPRTVGGGITIIQKV